MALFNKLVQIQIATSQTILDMWHNNFATRVASQVAEQLENEDYRELRNIKKTRQIWVETQPCFQSSKNLTLSIAVKKRAKLDNKFLKYCSILLNFFIFFQIFWPRLFEQTDILAVIWPSLFQIWIFGVFLYLQSISLIMIKI